MCCFMQARAEFVGFFRTEKTSPGQLAWDQRVVRTETESLSALPDF